MVQRVLLGMVMLLTACGAPEVKPAPLFREAKGDGFTLRMPEDAELLSRQMGSGMIDYRGMSDDEGVLLDITVHRSGQMPPLRAGESLEQGLAEPKRVYRQTGHDRPVVGYVWRRVCRPSTEIAAWFVNEDVVSAPKELGRARRRALSEEVARSIRVTPCGA